jgi:hypothetical protein
MSKLSRVGDAYVIADDELLVLTHGASTYPTPVLIATAFHTRTSGWRLLRLGCIDIGFAPTAELAVERLMEDWQQREVDAPVVLNEPFAGYDAARRALAVNADLPHRTAVEMLRLAIEVLDAMQQRRDYSRTVAAI